MKSFPKPKREVDPHYVWWVHSYECLICKRWPVQAHHVKTKGAGGSDRTCVPLCQDHHTGPNGVHWLGNIHFQKKFNIELDQEVLKFNQWYNEDFKGPHHHLLPDFKEGVLRSS